LVSHPAEEEGIGPVEVLDRVTMQVFVRHYRSMIAAPVQRDVDGIPKGPHSRESTIDGTGQQGSPASEVATHPTHGDVMSGVGVGGAD
jgi:hypothetical protein